MLGVTRRSPRQIAIIAVKEERRSKQADVADICGLNPLKSKLRVTGWQDKSPHEITLPFLPLSLHSLTYINSHFPSRNFVVRSLSGMHNLFRLSLVLFMLLLCIASVSGQYQVGVGIADITGPVTFTFMGYADWTQVGQGILQRVYARAFIVRDLESHKRMVFVNTDTQSMSDIVKKRVVQRLAEKYGDVYTTENVMLSSTHSHSGVGGYLQYSTFTLPSLPPFCLNSLVTRTFVYSIVCFFCQRLD